MNKRLIVVSFSICMLTAYTSYNQTAIQNNVLTEENGSTLYHQDSSIAPTDSLALKKIRLTTTQSNRYSRYKDLQKEKERRKKIREKYKKEKSTKN
ncbi:hypothetical protein [Aureispira anguillae]|uniref:Uncharacterized protein n=1 Tax=Aureispira anguillae TaxID=2864201 RepID=A0A915YHE9_9BACT|nr:hypothetical protein [Aureispira anguillae]BDS13214.1 hypothetical protein AsAng_0039430 [Aureispira anguillae]